ncbi:MAG: tryptophan 2,3-dioxygenase family protein [Phycisphaerales bacterium]|nr:tryptophan 2,3-dioxygenase family protein [Phycisphaerales bacterium]
MKPRTVAFFGRDLRMLCGGPTAPIRRMNDMALTYAKYLELDTLLDLQKPQSDPPEHDEMLFIVIHQTYELWFKLMLHEFEKVCRDFSSNDMYGAIATFKRLRTIMKTLVGQLDILETMTPMSFTSFRDRLETSSGFQSSQFREFEYMLGFKRPEMMKYCDLESKSYGNVEKRLHAQSLMDHFYEFLEHQDVVIPQQLKEKDATASTEPNPQIQEGLYKLYKSQPNVAILLELMTDFDEGQQEWRYRHVKVVERTIGNKKGTGGSLGVEFLKKSLFKPVFPDLWAIRHRL